MNVSIEKIEYYLPEKIITNEDLSLEFPEWSSNKIEDKIGIKQRHVVSENETALDLAQNVGNKLLSYYDKSKIDFLILCTQSPDYFLPTSACILQDKLGLGSNIGSFDFNLGCSGFIYGLAIAKGLIKAEIANNILLITSETYTKHIHPKDKANRTIFGDGAAATIISKSDKEKILNFDLGTNGHGMNNLIVPNGGMRNKFKSDSLEITDEGGNIRTDNNLFMNGPEIFNFTIENVPITVNRCLDKNKITLDQIDYVIFHQANKFILDHLRRKMNIPKEKFYLDMINTGNTVSSSIPIALKNVNESGIVKSGDKILLVGFGVGYSWGSVVIEN